MDDMIVDAGTRINIEIGTPTFVEVDGIAGKLKSRLVGMEPGAYLIITTPHGPPGTRGKLISGNRVTLRYINQGSIYGFDSEIIEEVSTPANLLFIAYPRVVAEQSLRKTKRFDCYISCHIETAGLTCDGTIVDISMTGCLCIIPSPRGKQSPQPLAMRSELSLSVASPDGASLALKGTVLNISEYHPSIRLGIEFQPLDEALRKELEKLILSISLG